MKALVGAYNQEQALVVAFSVYSEALLDTLFILEITVRRKRVAMVVPSPGSYW